MPKPKPVKKLPKQLPKSLEVLYERAKAVRLRSYSPYSECKVGAAIRLESGEIFDGCNVENSSYGGAICAERTAILKAVSEKGKIRIRELLVVTDATPPWPPCGFCRQTIAEFGKNPPVHFANLEGEVISSTLNELLPNAFRPEHLLR